MRTGKDGRTQSKKRYVKDGDHGVTVARGEGWKQGTGDHVQWVRPLLGVVAPSGRKVTTKDGESSVSAPDVVLLTPIHTRVLTGPPLLLPSSVGTD